MNWFNKKECTATRHYENLEQQLMWKGKVDSSFILKTVKGATIFFYKEWQFIVLTNLTHF